MRSLLGLPWLIACSGGNADAGRAGEFVGTWVLAAGATNTRECSGAGIPPYVTDLAGYQFVLAAGTSADLEMSSITNGLTPPTIAGWPDPSCPPYGAAAVHFEVVDDTAETSSVESCSYNVVMSGRTGYQVGHHYYPFTLVLDATGTGITLDAHDDVGYSDSPGCIETLVARASKQ